MLDGRYDSPLLRSRRTLSPNTTIHDPSSTHDAHPKPEESAAKRPRREIDSTSTFNALDSGRPILSSSYRPRARDLQVATSSSTTSLTPITSTSSSFSLGDDKIVTPTLPPPPPPVSNNNNNSFNSYRPNHSLPPKPSVSLPPEPVSTPILPPISFSSLSRSDLASKLDSLTSSLPPFLSSLPPRPGLPPIPASVQKISDAPPLVAASHTVAPLRLDSAVSSASMSTSTEPADSTTEAPATDGQAPPTAEEIRRRADEVIARLTGSAPTPSPTPGPSAPATNAAGSARSLNESVDDIIARLERDTKAREASYASARAVRPGPTIYRPPFPPYPMPTGYPVPPPSGGMSRPPPPGWRPPPGFGPSPGWRPPSFLHITASATSTTGSNSPAPVPLSPAIPISSQSTVAPLPTPESASPANGDNAEPILLPKKPKSPKTLKDRQPNPENQIYVGNLPHSTQLATLRKAFEAISPILTIELKAPYAMIEFEKDHKAQEAVDIYDEGTFGGVQIRVERATESEA